MHFLCEFHVTSSCLQANGACLIRYRMQGMYLHTYLSDSLNEWIGQSNYHIAISRLLLPICMAVDMCSMYLGAYVDFHTAENTYMREFFSKIKNMAYVTQLQQLGLGRAKARPEIWPAGHGF